MSTYTNLVILQGWLEIESVSVTIVNHMQIPVLNGWIYTTDQTDPDEDFEERHPALISGRPAEAVLGISRKLQDRLPGTASVGLVHVSLNRNQTAQVLTNQERPFVIAQGKLLSRQGHSCLDVRHLSVLGLPWGALDILTDLEPCLPVEAHTLLERLSETEKTQIGQALGVAMRSLISLRQESVDKQKGKRSWHIPKTPGGKTDD